MLEATNLEESVKSGRDRSAIGLKFGNESKTKAQTDILRSRRIRKPVGERRIDREVRGAETIIKALQGFALLGQLANEHGLDRSSVVFLLGVYVRQEQRTNLGIEASALRSYVNGWRGSSSRRLVNRGYLERLPARQLSLTYQGLLVVLKFISGMKYAHQNYCNSLKEARSQSRK